MNMLRSPSLSVPAVTLMPHEKRHTIAIPVVAPKERVQGTWLAITCDSDEESMTTVARRCMKVTAPFRRREVPPARRGQLDTVDGERSTTWSSQVSAAERTFQEDRHFLASRQRMIEWWRRLGGLDLPLAAARPCDSLT